MEGGGLSFIIEKKLSAAVLTKLSPACEFRSEAARKLCSQEFTNSSVDKDGEAFHSDKSDLLKVIAPKQLIPLKGNMIKLIV